MVVFYLRLFEIRCPLAISRTYLYLIGKLLSERSGRSHPHLPNKSIINITITTLCPRTSGPFWRLFVVKVRRTKGNPSVRTKEVVYIPLHLSPLLEFLTPEVPNLNP